MNKTIYIAPFYLQSDLLKEEKSINPFSHIKCISKEEILSSYYGKFQKAAIFEVMGELSFDFMLLTS